MDNDNNPGSHQLQQLWLCRQPNPGHQLQRTLWVITAEQLKNLKLHQFTDDWQEKHDVPTKQQQEPNKFIEKLVNSNTFMQKHRDDPQSSREDRTLAAESTWHHYRAQPINSKHRSYQGRPLYVFGLGSLQQASCSSSGCCCCCCALLPLGPDQLML